MNMYFIAIVAPENINQKVLKWKMWMKENYRCEAALKSPAHITLIPPFWMEPDTENDLIRSLSEYSAVQKDFPVQLNNFSGFKPHVIFIDVMKTDSLAKLKNDLENFLLKSGKFPLQKEDRSFHPHVTIAMRDLHKKIFFEAWEHFKETKYTAGWIAKGISLLRHNNKNWDVLFISQFS